MPTTARPSIHPRHPIELRVTPGVILADDFPGRSSIATLQGYVAVFDQPSKPIQNARGRPFIETIKPGAFTETLARCRVFNEEIRALAEHAEHRELARRGTGLFLAEDAKGLRFAMGVPYTADGRALMEDYHAGRIRGMSFGFSPVSFNTTTRTDLPHDERALHKVEIWEISFVGHPAYAGTEITERHFMPTLGTVNLRTAPPIPNPAIYRTTRQ